MMYKYSNYIQISKELDQKSPSPKITIKPIPKPLELEKEDMPSSTPKVTIKPIKRHLEENDAENDQERSSPKIIIKPVVCIYSLFHPYMNSPQFSEVKLYFKYIHPQLFLTEVSNQPIYKFNQLCAQSIFSVLVVPFI